jgi:arylsulfatase
VIAAALVLALVLLALRTRPPSALVMAVTVTVSTDEGDVAEVYRTRTSVLGAGGPGEDVTAWIDLGRWAGKLARLDIRGEVLQDDSSRLPAGHVAVRAEVVGPDGARPIQFVGWQNGGSEPFHLGTIGSPASVAPIGADSPFFCGAGGLLWYVLRIPDGAVLRLALDPVMAEELAENPRHFVPNVRTGWMTALRPPSSLVEPERPPDMFIYLIDALRPDHLGCYGYSRETSPSIDAFAAEAVVYEQAQTAYSSTRGSVATIFTGLYPCTHGAVHEKDGLAEWPVLLSEVLQESGYGTSLISATGMVGQRMGFNQGFDEFVVDHLASPERVNSYAAAVLNRQPADQPVFMYLHTIEPHAPYAPEPSSLRLFDRGIPGTCDGTREAIHAACEWGSLHPELSVDDIEHLVDLYDAEILDSDRGFGAFLELLKRTGRFEHALIVLVADHGEAFGEHDTLQHGNNLNRELLHVPLIIRLPQGRMAGTRVEQRVSLVELYPTILAQAGVAPKLDYGLPGRDLIRVTSERHRGPSRPIFAELSFLDNNVLDLVAVLDADGFKRVVDMSVVSGAKATERSVGLWDTVADPDEQEDLTQSLPVRAAYDEQLIAQYLATQRHWSGKERRAAPQVELTEELREHLRALGYLD